MKKLILTAVVIAFSAIQSFGQEFKPTVSVSVQKEKHDNYQRHFLGSSLWMVGNFAKVNPPCFYQLNYGYQLTQKDVILVEAITWTYYGPLGLETFGPTEQLYPGKVKAFGAGLGYQRFLWKKLFTTVEPAFFLQKFYDTDGKNIQKGFQLYLQFILGYRFEFFKKRMFIEPAYALKYWPVNTNFPAPFAAVENGTPKYKFEPSLNFGFRF